MTVRFYFLDYSDIQELKECNTLKNLCYEKIVEFKKKQSFTELNKPCMVFSYFYI